MNHDKARDFFSAYYEGTLEGGLKQSFEAKLRSEAVLQADYAAFVETVHELDGLRNEEIEIPIFLSDRIATRLEQAQGKQPYGLPAWTTWLRGVAFAGLAAVAIIFAIPLVRGNNEVSPMGTVTSGSNVDQIQFKAEGGKLLLLYQANGQKTVVVSSPVTGKEIQQFHLNGQNLKSPIDNPLQNAAIFKIQAVGDKSASLIAVPGQAAEKSKGGDGSVQDLAVALAGHYRVPVVIEAADVTHRVRWDFSSTDARAAANQAVTNEGFSVDQRQDGIIVILDR